MAIENFTTYTEEDDNNKLTVTATKADAVNADRDEDVYLYKDKDADHFDALDEEFEFYIGSGSPVAAYAGVGIANTVGTLAQFTSPDLGIGIMHNDVAFQIRLNRGTTTLDSYNISADTLYYCTLARAAGNDTVELKIYSDAARTNLLDTLAAAGYGTAKWRYIYGFANYNSGHSNYDFDGYVQNLDLNEPPEPHVPVADGDLIGIGIIRKS